MGVENNECVIATTWNHEAMADIQEWIETMEPRQQSLFAFTDSLINGKRTVVLGPDGSKKGWPQAEIGDSLREQLIERIEKHAYEDGSSPFNWVEVGYGEYGQKVLRGNCSNCYGADEYHGEKP